MDNVEEITLTSSGKNTEQAFVNIASNLSLRIINPDLIQPKLKKTIFIREKNLKYLLYKYLKSVYSLATTNLILLNKISTIKIENVNTDYLLTAVVQGDKLSNEYKIQNTIKMITDRNITVKEDMEGCHLSINIIVEKDEKV